jgi:hypothetical protein
MADTIITNSPEKSGGDSGAGWFVAIIILIAVIVGGIILYRHGGFGSAAPSSGTNINVTVPSPTYTPPAQ